MSEPDNATNAANAANADSAANTDNSEKKVAEEFGKILNTPIDASEADLAVADIEVERAQLLGVRNEFQSQILRLQLQIAGIEAKLRVLDLRRAVVARRAALPAKE